MSLVAASQPAPGKRPGKQNRPYFGLWGSPVTPSEYLRTGTRPFSSQRPASGGKPGFGGPAHMPKVAAMPATSAFCCFPPASPVFALGSGKQKTAPKDRFYPLEISKRFWSRERNRDPTFSGERSSPNCEFRSKAAGDSDAIQPLIPTQTSHRFQSKPATL